MKVFLFIHASTIGDTILSLDKLIEDLLSYNCKDIYILNDGDEYKKAYYYIELALIENNLRFKYIDFYDFISKYNKTDVLHIHYYRNHLVNYSVKEYIDYISERNIKKYINILNMVSNEQDSRIYITNNTKSKNKYISFKQYKLELPNTNSITINIDSARALNFSIKSWLSIIDLLEYDSIKVLTFNKDVRIDNDNVSVIYLDDNIDNLTKYIQSSNMFVTPNTGLVHLAYKIMDHENILSITNYEPTKDEYNFYNKNNTKKIIFADDIYKKYIEDIDRSNLMLTEYEIKKVSEFINTADSKSIEIYRR